MVKHPPGDEIYRDGIVSIFEVDGRKNKVSLVHRESLLFPWLHANGSQLDDLRYIAKTCVYWPRCSWTTKLFITMSNHSYSILWQKSTRRGVISSVTFQRQEQNSQYKSYDHPYARQQGLTWSISSLFRKNDRFWIIIYRASWHYPPINEKVMVICLWI